MNARVTSIKSTYKPADSLLEAMVQHLYQLASGKVQPMDPEEGICYELKQLFGGQAMEFVMAPVVYWEHYTGDPLFPIPCPFGGHPRLRFKNTANLWKDSKYGDLRRNLCLFLAAYHNGDL